MLENEVKFIFFVIFNTFFLIGYMPSTIKFLGKLMKKKLLDISPKIVRIIWTNRDNANYNHFMISHINWMQFNKEGITWCYIYVRWWKKNYWDTRQKCIKSYQIWMWKLLAKPWKMMQMWTKEVFTKTPTLGFKNVLILTTPYY